MTKRGRPKGSVKQKADWFKLSADEYDQDYILEIEDEFGLVGYALYIKTLQHLCKRDNQQFENNTARITRIARDLGADAETYQKFIKFCIEYDILIEADGMIRSPYLDDVLAILYEKREAKREKMRDYMQEKRKKEKEAKRKNNIKDNTTATATAEYNNNYLLHGNNDLLAGKQFSKASNRAKEEFADDDDAENSFFVLKKILKDNGVVQKIDEHIQFFCEKLSSTDEVIPKDDYDIVLLELIAQFKDPFGGKLDRIKNLPGAIVNAIKNDDYSIHIENAKKRKIEIFQEQEQEVKQEESRKQLENEKREREAKELAEFDDKVRSLIVNIKEKIENDEIVKARWESYEMKMNDQNLWEFMKSDERGNCKHLENKIKGLRGSFDLEKIMED